MHAPPPLQYGIVPIHAPSPQLRTGSMHGPSSENKKESTQSSKSQFGTGPMQEPPLLIGTASVTMNPPQSQFGKGPMKEPPPQFRTEFMQTPQAQYGTGPMQAAPLHYGTGPMQAAPLNYGTGPMNAAPSQHWTRSELMHSSTSQFGTGSLQAAYPQYGIGPMQLPLSPQYGTGFSPQPHLSLGHRAPNLGPGLLGDYYEFIQQAKYNPH